MALSIPLEIGIIVEIVQLVLIPLIVYFIVWALTPFQFPLMMANLMKHDVLFTDDGSKLTCEVGNKKNKSDSLYRTKKGLFGPVKYTKMDPTKWDQNNGTRLGNTVARFFYPGKMWPKPIPAMFASKTCLEVAATEVSPEITKYDKDAIIKSNRYLHLIAKNNPKKALTLLRAENRREIELYASQFLVLPEGTYAENLNIPEGKTEEQYKVELLSDIRKDLVEEVIAVREYCSRLPQEVSLASMMKAYPDRETCDELMAKVDAENQAEARAQSNMDVTKTLLIVGGLCVLFVLAIIIIIVIK